MNGKKSYNVGVLIGDMHTSYPMEMIKGICEKAKEFSCNLLFFLGTQSSKFVQNAYGYRLGDEYDYQFNMVYDYAKLGNLDALIISYGTVCTFLENFEKDQFLKRFEGIPLIVLEEPMESEDSNYIISDNYGGMSSIVEHLIVEHGYKNILYLGAPKISSDGRERERAYVDTMKNHGLVVKDSMIEYGNYLEFVDDEVAKLIDSNPDAEAIVCANDEMALGAYRECKRRGMIIGKDIAITGYDDFPYALKMRPPLTTVRQNGYDLGYRAMDAAIEICKGASGIQITLPARVISRLSCGCLEESAKATFNPEDRIEAYYYVEDKVGEIIQKSVLNMENRQLIFYMEAHIRKLILYIINCFVLLERKRNVKYDAESVIILIEEITNSLYSDFVSEIALLTAISDFLGELAGNAETTQKELQLVELDNVIQRNVLSELYFSKEVELTRFRQKTLVNPLFERNVLECINDEHEVFYQIAAELKNKKVFTSYIYVFDVPIINRKGDVWEVPRQMYLASCCIDGEIKAFDTDKRPIANLQKGFSDYLPEGEKHNLISFILYSGENQYGIMMCEIDPDEITAMYVTSLQIGNVLRFLEISVQEKRAQRQLEEKIKIIEDKNKILNFISEYDQLTEILNRRGFFENALKLNSQNIGKKAYFIFADLDHLKEINDCYGHSEGDYAIRSIAEVIKKSIGDNGLVGRLGGDEFVAMTVCEKEGYSSDLFKNIKNGITILNNHSKKPYYIETSIGLVSFYCSKEFEINYLLEEADTSLYEDKKKRRKSIIKDPA